MTQASQAPAPPDDVDAPIPLVRLVLVEMRKMLDTRAGYWLLGIIVLLTVLATGAVAWFGADEGTPVEVLLLAAGSPQGLLLPVLGVLLVTSEWGQRAAMTTFVLVPRRERIVVAKVLAALVVGLGVLAVTFVVAGVAALISGATLSETEPRVLGHFALLQVLGILQGLAFGALLLNSAAAIVAYFLLPVISSIVFSVVEPLQDLAPWLDVGSAQSPLAGEAVLDATDWAQLATACGLWIALPLALGAWRMLAAEVK